MTSVDISGVIHYNNGNTLILKSKNLNDVKKIINSNNDYNNDKSYFIYKFSCTNDKPFISNKMKLNEINNIQIDCPNNSDNIKFKNICSTAFLDSNVNLDNYDNKLCKYNVYKNTSKSKPEIYFKNKDNEINQILNKIKEEKMKTIHTVTKSYNDNIEGFSNIEEFTFDNKVYTLENVNISFNNNNNNFEYIDGTCNDMLTDVDLIHI